MSNIFESLATLYKSKTGREIEFDLECVETSEAKANFESDCQKMGLNLPKLTDFLESIAFGGMIKDLLKKSTDAVVHLYLLNGSDFASRDIGSPSDPYLIVTCGDTCINDRDNY